MKIRFNVRENETIWENFLDHFNEKSGIVPEHKLNSALAIYKAVDLPGTIYIEFEHERDLTMFLLRWSN